MSEFEPTPTPESESESSLLSAARELEDKIFKALSKLRVGWTEGSNRREHSIKSGKNTVKLVETEVGGHGKFKLYDHLEIIEPDGSTMTINPEENMLSGQFGVIVEKNNQAYFNSLKPDQEPKIAEEIEQLIRGYNTELDKILK